MIRTLSLPAGAEDLSQVDDRRGDALQALLGRAAGLDVPVLLGAAAGLAGLVGITLVLWAQLRCQRAASRCRRALRGAYEESAPNFYDVLGVERGASPGQIRSAYRATARDLHPDRHQDSSERRRKERQLRAVNDAYRVVRGASA